MPKGVSASNYVLFSKDIEKTQPKINGNLIIVYFLQRRNQYELQQLVYVGKY